MGLLGMRERVASLGGRLSLEAGRERGTTLHVSIPVAPTQVAPSPDGRAGTECPA
jgi:glucose-6-phosphate-specific signal transduction histidine kinase